MDKQTKKKALLASVAIVLGGVAVINLIFLRGEEPDRSLPDQAERFVVCLDTGQEYTITTATLAAPPFENPETGEMTCYPWYFNPRTGMRLIPNLEAQAGGPPKIPMVPADPETGSTAIQQYDPYFHEPDGDQPLPKWPGS